MKLIFFGTPQLAVPYLEWLSDRHTVVGVVTRPDEPAGRHHRLTAPPVKVAALSRHLPVFQPAGPWRDAEASTLAALGADAGVVIAYGRIMPEAVFRAPRLGCLNLHFSLLPTYRGAAPIQWALINGARVTGITAFWLDHGMDAGPIQDRETVPIAPEDDARTLRERMLPAGLRLLERVLRDLSENHVRREPQGGASTFAPSLKKENGCVLWSAPAARIVNLVRGVVEWPGAFTRVPAPDGGSKTLKILRAAVIDASGAGNTPGVVLGARKDAGVMVQAGTGVVGLHEVQPEGRKAMSGWDYWQGARLSLGVVLGGGSGA